MRAPSGQAGGNQDGAGAVLDQFGPVLLIDDRTLENTGEVPPCRAPAAADLAGQARRLTMLDNARPRSTTLNNALTTADPTVSDKRIDAERGMPADVAAEYPKQKGLLNS